MSIQTQITPEVIRKVYDYLDAVIKACDGYKNPKAVEKLGPRLKNLPSVFKELGLVATVAHLFGSAKESWREYLESTWSVLAGRSNSLKAPIEEKPSYAVTLAILLKIVDDLHMEIEGSSIGANAIDILRKVLKRFDGNTVLERMIELRLLPYLLALKKLGEALIPLGREHG